LSGAHIGNTRKTWTAFEGQKRKGFIYAYHNAARRLILLSGKKMDVLDFCKTTAGLPEIKIATLRLDMKALLEKLAEVNSCGFDFLRE
jgi:hypothetical protein